MKQERPALVTRRTLLLAAAVLAGAPVFAAAQDAAPAAINQADTAWMLVATAKSRGGT